MESSEATRNRRRWNAAADFTGRRVTVMGLGRFGGGIGAVQFLLRHGAAVTVTDLKSREELRDSLAHIDTDRLEALHLGGHCEKDFHAADLIVVNPAVRRDHPLLQIAAGAGIPLSSEMNLFWQHRRGPVIGVTGSNGKSTTAAMIHSILQAAGWNVHLGGNLGGSLLPRVDDIAADEWSVLELSSFQLHDLDRIPSSPEVAVVTNFAPNHLNWHGSLDEYRRAKQTILRWQPPTGIAVLNADDADVASWPHHGWCYFFGRIDHNTPGIVLRDGSLLLRDKCGHATEVPLWNTLPLPGVHNLQNALAAAATATAMGLSPETIERGLQSVQPLPHRLQFVGEWEGRRFYNDSLATTPESVFAALEAFTEPVVLLAGGSDKGCDLNELAECICRRTKAAALMGETADILGMLIEQYRESGHPAVIECRTFAESFAWAVTQSASGDVVLLSPGCASYDWFRDFADRGEQFTALVTKLQQTKRTRETERGNQPWEP